MQKKVFNSSVLIIAREAGGGVKALAVEHSIFRQRVVFQESFAAGEDYAGKLLDLLSHEDFLPLEVVYCPPAQDALQQSFTLPAAVAANLEEVIKLELQKHFPLPQTEISTGWDSPAAHEIAPPPERVQESGNHENSEDGQNSGDAAVASAYFLVSACALKRRNLKDTLFLLEGTALSPDYVCPLPMLLGRSLSDFEAALLIFRQGADGVYLGLYKDKVLVEGTLVACDNTDGAEALEILTQARKITARHRTILGIGGVGRIYFGNGVDESGRLGNDFSGAFGVKPLALEELRVDFYRQLAVPPEYMPLLLTAQSPRPETLNLWEKDERKLRLKSSTKIIVALTALLVLLCASIIGYGFFARSMRVSAIHAELKELAPQLEQVRKLQEQNSERRLLLKRSRELAGDSFSAIRFLQKISDLIPDHTFLIRISVSKEKKELKLSGYSMDIDDLEALISPEDFINRSKLHPPKIQNKFFEYYVFDWDLKMVFPDYEKLKAEGAFTATPPTIMLPDDHLISGKRGDKRGTSTSTNAGTGEPGQSSPAQVAPAQPQAAAPGAQPAPLASVLPEEDITEVLHPVVAPVTTAPVTPAAPVAPATPAAAAQDAQAAEALAKEAEKPGLPALNREEVDEIFKEIVSKMFSDYINSNAAQAAPAPASGGESEAGQGGAPASSGSKAKAPADDDLGWPVIR